MAAGGDVDPISARGQRQSRRGSRRRFGQGSLSIQRREAPGQRLVQIGIGQTQALPGDQRQIQPAQVDAHGDCGTRGIADRHGLAGRGVGAGQFHPVATPGQDHGDALPAALVDRIGQALGQNPPGQRHPHQGIGARGDRDEGHRNGSRRRFWRARRFRQRGGRGLRRRRRFGRTRPAGSSRTGQRRQGRGQSGGIRGGGHLPASLFGDTGQGLCFLGLQAEPDDMDDQPGIGGAQIVGDRAGVLVAGFQPIADQEDRAASRGQQAGGMAERRRQGGASAGAQFRQATLGGCQIDGAERDDGFDIAAVGFAPVPVGHQRQACVRLPARHLFQHHPARGVQPGFIADSRGHAAGGVDDHHRGPGRRVRFLGWDRRRNLWRHPGQDLGGCRPGRHGQSREYQAKADPDGARHRPRSGPGSMRVGCDRVGVPHLVTLPPIARRAPSQRADRAATFGIDTMAPCLPPAPR